MYTWDEKKNQANIEKHGVSFEKAKKAFDDPNRHTYEDKEHSTDEARFFCIGEVDGGILTVRYTLREDDIRIFGAGYWRKGKKLYEQRD